MTWVLEGNTNLIHAVVHCLTFSRFFSIGIIEPSANGDAALEDEGRSESHRNRRLGCDLPPAPLLYNVRKILAEPAQTLKQLSTISI